MVILNQPQIHNRWSFNKVKRSRPYLILALIIDPCGQPVGCVFVYAFETYFYVMKDHRRQGLAKQTWKELKKQYDIGSNVVNLGDTEEADKLRQSLGIARTLLDMRLMQIRVLQGLKK